MEHSNDEYDRRLLVGGYISVSLTLLSMKMSRVMLSSWKKEQCCEDSKVEKLPLFCLLYPSLSIELLGNHVWALTSLREVDKRLHLSFVVKLNKLINDTCVRRQETKMCFSTNY